jgi:hypothetical protein
MPFTAQLFFSGLGLALFRTSQRRSRTPNRVDLYALQTPMHPSHRHVPRFSSELRDVVKPIDIPIFGLRPTPDGTIMTDILVKGQSLALKATGRETTFDVEWAQDPSVVQPGEGAPENAIDWLPSCENVGLDSALVHPDEDEDRAVYAAALSLPPGKIRSRRILFGQFKNEETEDPLVRQAFWRFPAAENPRVMADQLVWTRSGLESLSIRLSAEDGKTYDYLFDAGMRLLDRDEPVVKLAFTNFPENGLTGRFGRPRHFPMYSRLAIPSADIMDVDVELETAGPVTGQGSCPPVHHEFVE